MEKLKIQEAIVVEGRYDKNTLAQCVDTLIIPINGFGIFKDKAQRELLRRIAAKRGIVVLTDSDGAGFVIRNHLKSILPPSQLKHAYLPDLYGKERRKRVAGKEGKLGAEGMPRSVLEQALRQAGATIVGTAKDAPPTRLITRQDLYLDGLSGRPDSAAKRKLLSDRLSLPEHLSAKALPEVLNTVLGYEAYRSLIEELFS